MEYDLAILGGGPAGLTSAIYAGRYAMETIVIANDFGGTAGSAGEIENWPGQIGSGFEIMQKIEQQAKQFGAILYQSQIQEVTKENDLFKIKTSEKEILAKTVIVTLGTKHRHLNIPGEKEFLGRGVSYCATCDGNFFKNKIVTVIGGSDSAAKAALYLSEIATKVYIVYRKQKLRCEPIYFKRIHQKENIETIYNSNPTEIIGENLVQKIKIKDNDGNESEIETNGIFVEIGADPSTEILSNLNLELENEYIKTDKHAKTSTPGLFAAGDITNIAIQQMITAAGEGATAAYEAYNYLMSK